MRIDQMWPVITSDVSQRMHRLLIQLSCFSVYLEDVPLVSAVPQQVPLATGPCFNLLLLFVTVARMRCCC